MTVDLLAATLPKLIQKQQICVKSNAKGLSFKEKSTDVYFYLDLSQVFSGLVSSVANTNT